MRYTLPRLLGAVTLGQALRFAAALGLGGGLGRRMGRFSTNVSMVAASESVPIPRTPAPTPSHSVIPGTSEVEDQPVVTPLCEASTVMVVGGTRGIGLEFVQQLLSKGCNVIATHRGSAPPAELAALGACHAGKFSTLSMDVGDEASIAAAADKLSQESTQLTHIIHNAGIYGPPGSLDGQERFGRPAASPTTKEAMMDVFSINAVGPFLVAQQFSKVLGAPSGQLPIIAILTSKVGSVDDNGSGGAYAYRASKSACNIIAKSLYVDLRSEEKATMVLLHPGYVRTDMTSGKGLIDADESVAGMLRAVEATGPSVPFRFVDYKACRIPW
uniref:Uncharacterized protein n=1 Tax=Phaeomonas parva TaxID=124430 RepID=A0A7S1XNG1_9STRA|mmetsp:Transcript_24562/g.77012  ORF Transcript_24562/g.77012 Transcript_24562/m.77012 type:complete len:329 (+) Transcript_24562:158-1144(+)